MVLSVADVRQNGKNFEGSGCELQEVLRRYLLQQLRDIIKYLIADGAAKNSYQASPEYNSEALLKYVQEPSAGRIRQMHTKYWS
jgi:hypothetical protein